MQQLGRFSKHAEQKQAGHKKQLATMTLFMSNSTTGEMSQATVKKPDQWLPRGMAGVGWGGAWLRRGINKLGELEMLHITTGSSLHKCVSLYVNYTSIVLKSKVQNSK